MAKREEFDVCVIGTGAGGGVMIQELTAAGFRVVALQRGPFLQPSDFHDDELGTIIRDELFSADQVETYRRDEHSPTETGRFNYMANCVGGTMTHWAAWSWRFLPDDFKVLSTEGPVAGASLADWPITYDEMEPFYERAEWEFGVSGDAKGNPFGAPRKKGYPNPAHPGRVASDRLAKAMRKLGHHPFPTPVGVNSQSYGGRPECAYGGSCLGYGCPINAKATSLSVCIPKALATGKLDLRPNATAREITVGDDGRARSVRYLDDKGGEHEVFARTLVVSGNAVGTPHLLLMSKSGRFPHGLANSSGQVGHHLTLHHVGAVAFTIDEPSRGTTGLHSHLAFDDFHPTDAKRGFIRGGVVGEANSPVNQPLIFALTTHLGCGKRGWGSELKHYLRTHRQHPNDFAMNRWYTQRMLEVADAAGAIEKWDATFYSLPEKSSAMKGFMHFHGTCRMGDDPASSVVDRWCRSHDVKNLWLVDGSCFPTSGGYNPTLTILANAYRVADHFVREAKRQNT